MAKDTLAIYCATLTNPGRETATARITELGLNPEKVYWRFISDGNSSVPVRTEEPTKILAWWKSRLPSDPPEALYHAKAWRNWSKQSSNRDRVSGQWTIVVFTESSLDWAYFCGLYIKDWLQEVGFARGLDIDVKVPA